MSTAKAHVQKETQARDYPHAIKTEREREREGGKRRGREKGEREVNNQKHFINVFQGILGCKVTAEHIHEY